MPTKFGPMWISQNWPDYSRNIQQVRSTKNDLKPLKLITSSSDKTTNPGSMNTDFFFHDNYLFLDYKDHKIGFIEKK